jgi:ABC-type uncharacterized transport system permease subunit
MQNTLFYLAALIYAASAFLPARMRAAVSAGTLLAWLLHGGALWADMLVRPGSLRLGFAVVLSATLWISVAAYWLENRNFSLDSLRVLVLPCAAIAVVLPALFPGSVVPLQDNAGLYAAHIVIAILAYSTLTVAAFHAVLMAVQEASLHAPAGGKPGWFRAMIERLPALLTMEKLLFRMIGFGFLLLTLTVLSGVVFSEELFGRPMRWDHKTVFTLLSWLLFGLLLAGRRWRGWRGKTALSFTLSGFATLLLGYVGSRFVLEVLLHRSLA